MKTSFKPHNNEDVINKTYLDEKISKTEGQISNIEKKCNDCKLHNTKQSVEEIQIEKAVETTIQIVYDKGFFVNYNKGNANKVLNDYFPIEVNDRRRPDSRKVNDVIQWFSS